MIFEQDTVAGVTDPNSDGPVVDLLDNTIWKGVRDGTSTPLPGSEESAELSEEEQKQIYADYAALNQVPGVTPGVPMGLPENATTVRVEGGKTLTTDGPFVGMKEAVSGWFVLEADDLDAAIKVAARVPAARLGGAIEIRPSEVYW